MSPQFTHDQLMAMAIEDLPRKQSVCKYCKKGGFQWLNYRDETQKTKWVLVEVHDGILSRHKCIDSPA